MLCFIGLCRKKGNSGNCRFRIFDETSGKSGDGGFADEFGKEYQDVRGNLRFVGFGRNPKGDSSFFIFYSALDILTIAIKITLTDFKNRNRMLLTKVTAIVTKI